MAALTDDELIAELKNRFDHTKQALHDVKMVTKKLEGVNRKLESSEKVKSNFVSHMKNEINNPLASIMGLAKQLDMAVKTSPDMVASMGESIHAEAFSLDFQLRNIFAAAEMESGDTDLQVSFVDVFTLVKDGVDSFRHLCEVKHIEVKLFKEHPGGDSDKMLFKTDPEKLALVFSNLLSNAIEFNIDNGTVEIHIELSDGRLTLAVKDSGVGIKMSDVNRVFDRFHQLDSGVMKTHKGHGLGLSITKAIVDTMEGSVSVNSNGAEENDGCTFTVSMPEVEVDVEADAFSVDGNEFFFDDDDIEAF